MRLSILLLAGGSVVAGILSATPPIESSAHLGARLDVPSATTSLRFLVVGDTQGFGGINSVVWPAMANDMNAHNAAFVLFCGDLVSGGSSAISTIAEWGDWTLKTGTLNATRYMSPGNHDFYGGTTFSDWTNTFSWLPTSNSPIGEEGATYYFDAGNTRIISVSTDYPGGGGLPNQAWLDTVLAASGGFDHVFVFSHRPVMFSASEPTGGSGGAFWQSLISHDVDGYFSGHWHRYQPDRISAGTRTWETVIGTGGGWQGFQPIRPYQQRLGYLLVEINGQDATGTFFGDADSDGHWDDPLDSFTFRSSVSEPVGLVAKYDFDAGSALDSAPPPLGKGIDGTLKSGATLGLGLSGPSSLLLDGNGAHVEAGAIGDYNLSINGDLTLSIFAAFDTLGSGAWDNPLLCYGTADFFSEDEETNYSYWLSLRDDRTLVGFWEYLNGSDVVVQSSVPAPVAAGTPHHYALTRDAAAMEVKFWVDGQQLGAPVPFTHLPSSGGRGMLYLGADVADAQALSREFDGRLDDVTIYNRVLTQVELAALAIPAPTPPPTPYLVVPLLTAGIPAQLEVHDATAGGTVAFLVSLASGWTSAPAGPCSGLSIPLASPTLLATATADSVGTATHLVAVPSGTVGLSVWAFGVDVSTCQATAPIFRVIL